jgi:hypothetical protein
MSSNVKLLNFRILNRNMSILKASLVGTFPAVGNATTLSYPDSFANNNCIIAGVSFQHSTLGWITINSNYTTTAEVSLLSAGVRVKTVDSGLAGANFRILLVKL